MKKTWDFGETGPFQFGRWKLNPGGGYAKIRWISGEPEHDVHCGKHALYSKQLGQRGAHLFLSTPFIKPAQVISASIYCRGKGSVELRLYLYGGKRNINKQLQTIDINSKTWKKCVFNDFYVTPEEAKHARLAFVFFGEIRCDDIVIEDSKTKNASSGVPLPPGAKLVFEENFNNPDALKGWTAHKGDWKLKDGALFTSGGQAYIVYNKALGKNLRVEYTAWSNENVPYDLSAILNTDPKKANWRPDSYYFAFGSMDNLENFIFARGKIIERNQMILAGNESGIVPNKRHRVIAQKYGDSLTLFVDGKQALQCDDMFSGNMKGRSFGFFIHRPGYIDDVKVYDLPVLAGGVNQPELKPEITVHEGFDTLAGKNLRIKDRQSVKRVNMPTWVYREKEKAPEKYVDDFCLKISPENEPAVVVRKIRPVRSGIIEFDLMGKNLGKNGIQISLIGANNQIASTFVIDENGTYHCITGSGRKKLQETIEYMRRRTIPARFFFRKNRWYTLRIAFDCKTGIVRNIAVINLFTAMKYRYNSSLDKSKGEFYSLGGNLSFVKSAEKITGISIQVSVGSDFRLDNLCAVGPVGHTFVNGKDRRLPLRTLLYLSFPERKDPFDVKILSLRNLYNVRKNMGRESCHNGYSYFLLRDKNNPAYKPFNNTADKYNGLLSRQAFLREKAQMLRRTGNYLKDSGLMHDKLHRKFNQVFLAVKQSDELLQDTFLAYTQSFADSLNVKELTRRFAPSAEKLDLVITSAEKLLKKALENLPAKSIPVNGKFSACPSVAPKNKPVWQDGQWRRNGKPCFYYYQMKTIPQNINKVLGVFPGTFEVNIGTMPLKRGEFVNTSYLKNQYDDLQASNPGAFAYFNTRCGLHFCEFEVPRWWIEKYTKDDPDILFRDAYGQGPLISSKHRGFLNFYKKHRKSTRSAYVSLNFWNRNVKNMLNAKFDAFSKAIKNNFRDEFAFYILGWEAGNCGPKQIETGHNPSAIKQFHMILKKEYKTIGNLNRIWQTDYPAFDKIIPPQKPVAPCGVQYEFQRFRQLGYKSWVGICRNAVKNNTPACPIVFDTNKSMFGSRKDGFDILTYFAMTDIAAFHTYWELRRKVNDRLLDSARKACGKTIGNNEWSAVMCCPEMFVEDVLKNNGIQSAFHRMMWGQGMSTVWYGNTSGDWLDSAAIADPRTGTLLLRYHSTYIPILIDRSRRFGGIALEAPSVQPDVAILESISSYYNSLPVRIMRRSMEDIGSKLGNSGFNYGFLFEQLLLDNKQSLAGIQTIVIVNGTCLPEVMSDKLEKWIKKGGTLICLAPAGVYNRYGKSCGKLLKKAFPGLTWQHDKLFNWTPTGKNIPKPVKTLKNCNVYGANLGKGKVYVFSRPDANKQIKDFTAEIVTACTKRSFYAEKNKFDLCMRKLNGKYYLYVLNPSLYGPAEDEIVIRGKISGLIDRGLEQPVLVPFKYINGKTFIKLKLAAAEGSLFEFKK